MKKIVFIILLLIVGSGFLLFNYLTISNCDSQQIEILFHSTYLCVEVADTPYKMKKGLMFRKKLDPNHGMLFIYDKPKVLRFWMKNTFIPLDIGFFDKDRFLIEKKSMEPLSEKIIHSPEGSKYALEVNSGWFEKNKIELGNGFFYAKEHLKNKILSAIFHFY